MPLRLAEAQQLHDGLQDELLRSALTQFFEQRRLETMQQLVQAIRRNMRDTMLESRLTGRIDALESAMDELRAFAREGLKEAVQ